MSTWKGTTLFFFISASSADLIYNPQMNYGYTIDVSSIINDCFVNKSSLCDLVLARKTANTNFLHIFNGLYRQ